MKFILTGIAKSLFAITAGAVCLGAYLHTHPYGSRLFLCLLGVLILLDHFYFGRNRTEKRSKVPETE
jgi:hypothetical protein